MSRGFRGTRAAMLGAMGIVLLSAAPGGAHSAAGTMSLEAGGRPGLTIEVRVALSYTSDGHPAEEASVTATATGPGGATAGPVKLEPVGLGGYQGELVVTVPGSWTVAAISEEPEATAEQQVDVEAPTSTATPDPDPDSPARADADAGESTEASDADDSDATVWIAGVAVVALLAGAGGWWFARRRR